MGRCKCDDWARVPGQFGTNPLLPISKHHPACGGYIEEIFFSVRLGSGNCKPFVCEAAELVSMLEGESEPAMVTPIKMTRDQFDRLSDYEGP
jgi:hypothetical protein